eukprot:5133818-Prorocentrum_lima.AAC.1
MTSSLVGSEMCIRDRLAAVSKRTKASASCSADKGRRYSNASKTLMAMEAVSYTHLTLPTICSV